MVGLRWGYVTVTLPIGHGHVTITLPIFEQILCAWGWHKPNQYQTNTNQDMHQTSTKHAPNMQIVVGSYFDAIHMHSKSHVNNPICKTHKFALISAQLGHYGSDNNVISNFKLVWILGHSANIRQICWNLYKTFTPFTINLYT